MNTESVSLILPMFNEKDYLEKAVSQALAALESFAPDFEIIIVDDASFDGSEKTADTLSRKNRKIRVLHHKKNRKLGGVLKTGFSAATKEVVIYTDMDIPFDFCRLKDFIRLVENADIVNGYRVVYNESLKRQLYSKVYNLLIRAVFGLKVKDVNFAMKIFKKNALDCLDLKSEGSFISAEALIRAQYLGYKIAQVPVEYFPRHWGRSQLSSPGVIAKIIYEMLKFFPELTALRIKMAYLYAKARLHNFIRELTCPFKAIIKYIPQDGDIYDLGCGYGLLLKFLPDLTKSRRKFTGFDIDPVKIKMASILNNNGNAIFQIRDITQDLGISGAKCITIMDALVLLPFLKQEEILIRCFDYLSDNGILILKDTGTRPLWKHAWHQIQVILTLKVFKLTRGSGPYCRPQQGYASLLKKIGYKVEAVDIQKGYPYPHILYICTKQRGAY